MPYGGNTYYGKLFMDGCCIGTIGSVGTLTATSTYYSPIRIKDVNILAENKVVEVTFYGGDKQKAVCDEKDTFDLETAISICITKHLLGGTKAYNDAVKCGMKVYKDKQKKIAEEEKLKKLIANKRAKRLAKKQKQAEKKREEAITIQTEAYIRAMKAMKEAEVENNA